MNRIVSPEAAPAHVASPAEAAAPTAPRRAPGILTRLRAAAQERLNARNLELLAADDLSVFHAEDENGLAIRIRSVSRWLGSPLGSGLVKRAGKVRLYAVEDEAGPKERLRLTDEGVNALARRVGGEFHLVHNTTSEGFVACTVQASFRDGSVLEGIGRAKSDEEDAPAKAQAVAQRLLIYRRLGIPMGRPASAIDMAFVTPFGVPTPAREAVLVAAVVAAPETAPDPAPVTEAVSVPAPVVALSQGLTPVGPSKDRRERLIDGATGEILVGASAEAPTVVETADGDLMRREISAYLRANGYKDAAVVASMVQGGLGLQDPKPLKELSEAQVQVLFEDLPGLFPSRALTTEGATV